MSKNYSKYFTAPDMKASKKRTRNEVNVVYTDLEFDDKIKQLATNSKYYIRTYGCQMNVHDTEVICGILEELGFERTENYEEAQLLMFNTCAIRENAENKVFGEIGRLKYLKKRNPDTIFAICGCMSQEASVVEKILTIHTFVDVVFGTHNIHRLPEILKHAILDKEKVIEVWSHEGQIIEDLPKKRDNDYKAWVNIIYGCDKFCTYCIVPFTRGKERSRHPKDILEEIKELYSKGYKEVTLLGQNVNAYGKDLKEGYTMSNLLEDVAKIGIPRIRFTTSHPWDFDDEMIEIIKKYDNICAHIHLPVQSGNNEILKIMGRSYTRESYLKLFDKLNNINDNMCITTDVIVGYPNETEEQFNDTLSLYEYCKFDTAFTFIYSPREGTPAAKMIDNVDLKTKQERLLKLNKRVNLHMKEKNASQVGRTLQVLVDGVSRKQPHLVAGYSKTLKLVLFEGDEKMIGKTFNVEIISANNTSLIGKIKE